MDNDVKLGRFISLILRHKPETIDLKLDENGWADTKELIKKLVILEEKLILKHWKE